MNITYRKATIDDIIPVTNLMLLLYSEDNTFENLYSDNLELLISNNQSVFLALESDDVIGFSQSSIRFDYVEGTSSRGVGFLEGIFVSPNYRKKGIAKELVIQCENWASEMGYKEFASDCELTNIDSYNFHLSIGFNEVNRIICFTKPLKSNTRITEIEHSTKLGRYRHYKGNEYELIDIARHSETLEDMAVYRALYGEHGLWVRPLSMWNETVEVDGKSIKRFTLIEK